VLQGTEAEGTGSSSLLSLASRVLRLLALGPAGRPSLRVRGRGPPRARQASLWPDTTSNTICTFSFADPLRLPLDLPRVVQIQGSTDRPSRKISKGLYERPFLLVQVDHSSKRSQWVPKPRVRPYRVSLEPRFLTGKTRRSE